MDSWRLLEVGDLNHGVGDLKLELLEVGDLDHGVGDLELGDSWRLGTLIMGLGTSNLETLGGWGPPGGRFLMTFL